MALWRIVLQDIAVYCDAEYLRLGLHPNGHLNRQVSLLMQPYPHSLYLSAPAVGTHSQLKKLQMCVARLQKFVEQRDLGAAHPYQSVRPENSSI